ncbi:MAG: YdbL family protein [Proteobacteria bacterium]|nr:YdbL family protein [Pseudomonadota bacterium]
MKIRQLITVAVGVCLVACVTVNVYFPESATERAADIFIKDVYGHDEQTPTEDPGSPQGAVKFSTEALIAVVAKVSDFILPSAYAQQPDINISTPAVTTLRSAMEQRHRELKSHYDSGAVGMAATGLIILRDPKLVPLQDRNTIKKLVVDENADRNRLYTEIAKANGHPEWQKDIREIFAERWVGNAPTGWWYESAGKWQTK